MVKFSSTPAHYRPVIGETIFPSKDFHKVTWISPERCISNQIDHIAIGKMWRSSVLDVRNKSGADIVSNNHLIVGEFRFECAATRKQHNDSKQLWTCYFHVLQLEVCTEYFNNILNTQLHHNSVE